MADLGTITGASPLDADDTTYETSNDQPDLQEVTIALGDMPAGFAKMDSLSYQLIAKLRDAPPGSGPDTYRLEWCIVNAAQDTVLAGASFTYADRFESANVTSNSDQTFGSPTAFTVLQFTDPYDKSIWDSALINLRFHTTNQNMAPDNNAIQVDYFQITGTYTPVAPEEPGAGEVASSGLAPILNISLTPSPESLSADGIIPDYTRTEFLFRFPDAATLATGGLAPSAEEDHVVFPATKTLGVSGLTSPLGLGIPVATESLSIAGITPVVKEAHIKTPALETLAIAGLVPAVLVPTIRAPPLETLTVSGAGLEPTVVIDKPIRVPSSSSAEGDTGRAWKGAIEPNGYWKGPINRDDYPLRLVPGTILFFNTQELLQPASLGLSLSSEAPDVFSPPEPPTETLTLTGLAPAVLHQVDTAALIITGAAPTVLAPTVFTPDVEALSITGLQPEIPAESRQPAKEELAIAGLTPVVDLAVPVAEETLSIAGLAPVVDLAVPVAEETLSIAGLAPVVDLIVSVAEETLSIAGLAPVVDLTVPVAEETLSIAGLAPVVDLAVSVAEETLSIAGLAPSIDHFASPAIGTLSLSGQTPLREVGLRYLPATVALTLGPETPVLHGRPVVPPGALYITSRRGLYLDGLTPTVIVPVVSPTLTPDPEALTLAGLAPTLDLGIAVASESLATNGLAPSFTWLIQQPAESLSLTGQAPSVDLTIPGASGALALGPLPPTVERNFFPTVASGSLSLAGQAPSLTYTVVVGEETLTVSGLAPSVEEDHVASPAVETLTLSGLQPELIRGDAFVPAIETLSIGGLAPNVTVFVDPDTGTMAVSGLQPTLGFGFIPAVETLTLSGLQPFSNEAHSKTPAIETLALSGQQPLLSLSLSVPAEELTTSGLAPSAEELHLKTPAIESLSLAGLQPEVARQDAEVPPAGALSLNGLAPEITRFADPPAETLALAGLQPSAEESRVVSPAAETLSLSGLQPSAEEDHVASPAAGTLSLGGLQPTVEQDYLASPATESLSLTGLQPTALRADNEPVPSGSLSVAGLQPSRVITVSVIDAPAGGVTFATNAPTVTQTMLAAPTAGVGLISGKTPVAERTITSLQGAHLTLQNLTPKRTVEVLYSKWWM